MGIGLCFRGVWSGFRDQGKEERKGEMGRMGGCMSRLSQEIVFLFLLGLSLIANPGANHCLVLFWAVMW